VKTPEELVAMGLAEWWRGHLIPILKGGDDGDGDGDDKKESEEKKETEKDKTAAFVAPQNQAELDSMIADRVRRARAGEKEKYSDYEEAKRKAEAFDKIEESNKSELEKAAAAREAAEKERDEAIAASKEAALRVQVIAEGTRKNMADPEDALALLDRSVLDYDAEGVATNVGEALDTLLKAKPHLVRGGRSGDGADQGARENGAQQMDSLDGLTPEQIAKALEEGKLDEYLKTPNK
jgi:hypothetical protein